MTPEIQSGVIIGAAGGAVAGLILWIVNRINEYELNWHHRRRIYKWLDRVTSPEATKKWRSTRAIASFNNLTEDRVRQLCSEDKRITLSTKEREVWSIKGRGRDQDDIGQV